MNAKGCKNKKGIKFAIIMIGVACFMGLAVNLIIWNAVETENYRNKLPEETISTPIKPPHPFYDIEGICFFDGELYVVYEDEIVFVLSADGAYVRTYDYCGIEGGRLYINTEADMLLVVDGSGVNAYAYQRDGILVEKRELVAPEELMAFVSVEDSADGYTLETGRFRQRIMQGSDAVFTSWRGSARIAERLSGGVFGVCILALMTIISIHYGIPIIVFTRKWDKKHGWRGLFESDWLDRPLQTSDSGEKMPIENETVGKDTAAKRMQADAPPASEEQQTTEHSDETKA